MGGSTDPLLSEAVRGLMPSIRASFYRLNQPAHRPLGMYAPRARRRLFQNYLQRQQLQLQIQPLQFPPEVAEVVEIAMEIQAEDQENRPPLGDEIILIMEEIAPDAIMHPPGPRIALRILDVNDQDADA
ncbi:protein UL21A [Cercopithecine betaherpesvirus 5]|uniref:Protein UL21A n=1 Tax=Simian cytomegalovirus (strain Colburn) TaxID=50292 RepID=G8XT93_SCMVC|nr:protein UL21A [Cercopithecine betaherpesvirus 5]AEV80386.1 protein UL21A [Cercopithecine betaherpesvirus 5]